MNGYFLFDYEIYTVWYQSIIKVQVNKIKDKNRNFHRYELSETGCEYSKLKIKIDEVFNDSSKKVFVENKWYPKKNKYIAKYNSKIFVHSLSNLAKNIFSSY